jgi:hypothetical protein
MPIAIVLFFATAIATELQLPLLNTLFQFRRNHKLLLGRVVFDAKQVRFAAYLAVFDIRLPAASRLIHRRLVALAAACALESGLHATILGRSQRLPAASRSNLRLRRGANFISW